MQTLQGFGRTKLALIAVVAVMLIGTFSVIALRVSSPALSSLYTNITLEDSSKIVMELGKLGVPYELRTNGTEIMVPAERVLRLRMTLAQMGLPSGGSVVGYEIFDKSDTFGSSNTVMNVNMLRALEGETARTISSFNQVESARVHLVLPKREMFSKTQSEASASVALKLRGGQELSKAEIAAVTHFVAAAVPGMKTTRITVVDSYGRLLARGDGDDSIGAMASASEEFRISYENRMRDTLENLIEKVVGLGKVRVQLSADMNFDRVVTEDEKYDPEGQVARSVQSTTKNEKAQDSEGKDNTSVANQLPGANGAAGAGNSSNKDAEESGETTNFEISKTTKKHVKEGGSLNRMSVAVLVDGTYTGEDDKKTYQARPEEELKRIETLVKSAIGFDEKRGDKVEVVNMQFTKVETTEESESIFASFKHELEGIIQTLIIAGVAILAIMLVLRPAIVYLMKQTAAAAAAAPHAQVAIGAPGGGGMSIRLPSAATGEGGASAGGGVGNLEEMEDDDSMIDIANIKGRVKSSTLRKVTEVVEKNPEEAMSVVRAWLNNESS